MKKLTLSLIALAFCININAQTFSTEIISKNQEIDYITTQKNLIIDTDFATKLAEKYKAQIESWGFEIDRLEKLKADYLAYKKEGKQPQKSDVEDGILLNSFEIPHKISEESIEAEIASIQKTVSTISNKVRKLNEEEIDTGVKGKE